MSWLGLNGSSRDDFKSLSDAYASMYAPKEEQLKEGFNPVKKASPMDTAKDPYADTTVKKEAFEAWLEEQYELGADFSEFTEEEVAQYFAEEVLGDMTEGWGKILSKVGGKALKRVGKNLNTSMLGSTLSHEFQFSICTIRFPFLKSFHSEGIDGENVVKAHLTSS